MNQASWRFVWILRLRVLVLSLVCRARCAEPAFVMTLVKRVVPFRSFRFRDPSPEFADTLVMKRLGRAHEDVVTAVSGIQAECGSHLLEILDNVISLFFRGAIVSLRCALDVDAVLVGAGEKEGLNSPLSF